MKAGKEFPSQYSHISKRLAGKKLISKGVSRVCQLSPMTTNRNTGVQSKKHSEESTKFRIVLCLLSLVSLAVLSWPTLAHATYSGKNGRIAFILGPDVYTMNSDGADIRQLTHLGDTAALWESWSPDGKQIIFNIFSPPFFSAGQIWVMNADGSNQHLLLKEDNFDDERPSLQRMAAW